MELNITPKKTVKATNGTSDFSRLTGTSDFSRLTSEFIDPTISQAKLKPKYITAEQIVKQKARTIGIYKGACLKNSGANK